MATAWNLADLFEVIAAHQPDRPAVIQGARVVTWEEMDRSADALAQHLLAVGLPPQAKVGAYLYNSAEYLITFYGAFKAGLVPFNTNYRYGAGELRYIFDNADAEAIVFHTCFAPQIAEIRADLPMVKAWIAVREGDHPVPDWAVELAALKPVSPPQRPVKPPAGRGADDLKFLYTGGTTGRPKAVMLRQEDVLLNLGLGADPARGLGPLASLSEAGERAASDGPRPVGLVAAPLMHGTGIFSALRLLTIGGAVVLLPSRRFVAEELWDEVDRLKIESVVLVGMAFAAPMLEVLEANPGRWDLSSLRALASTGTMWSQENKAGLLRHCRNAVIMDNLASSEAPGYGTSTSSADQATATARFMLPENAAVFTEDGRRVKPGSGERGLLAVTGRLPLGYFKDPEKTAETFRVFEGKRWSVPGDWAEIESDGAIKLLGRGSVSINTGGEKVFPEEVEEALKSHAKVRDAVVVGVPDPRFGERICALVEPVVGQEVTFDELRQHVRQQLADYKSPRELIVVETVGRAPNGKVDYKASKAHALSVLQQRSAATSTEAGDHGR